MEMKDGRGSSAVDFYGYDPQSMTLRIQYPSGTYDYFNVPPDVAAEMDQAASLGTYVNEFVKDAGYRYRKVN